MATTGSPTATLSESPSGSGLRLTPFGSTLITAMSLPTSTPTRVPLTRWVSDPPLLKTMLTLSALWPFSSTTCALVRMLPSLSTTKPVPSASPLCGWPN